MAFSRASVTECTIATFLLRILGADVSEAYNFIVPPQVFFQHPQVALAIGGPSLFRGVEQGPL